MLKINYRKMKGGRRIIDAILSHNGTRIEVSTGIVLPDGVTFEPPRTFRGGNSSIKSELATEMHNWEEVIRNRYESIVTMHGTLFSADVFRAGIKMTVAEARGDEFVDNRTTLSAFANQHLDRVISGKITKKNDGLRHSKRTVNIRQNVVNLINEFVLKYNDFDFGRYNMATESVLGRLAVISAYDDMCETLKSFLMNDKNLAAQTMTTYIQHAIQIIKERADAHGISISDRYLMRLRYVRKIKPTVIAMSQEQFEWILNNEEKIRHDVRLTKNMNGFVDYMITALLTAIRIGDLKGLTMNNLIKTKEGYKLILIPKKTKSTSGVKVEIPVHDRLIKIFLDNASRYDGKLLPHMGETDPASERIRSILKRYEIFNNEVQVMSAHGELMAMPFWKAFKFHSTRASLITYLLSIGEQETVIKSISGHTLDSSSFKSYTNISNDAKNRAMQKVSMIGVN